MSKLRLRITSANGSVQNIALDQRVVVPTEPGVTYAVVDDESGQPGKDLVLKKQGDALIIEEKGQEVVELDHYYSQSEHPAFVDVGSKDSVGQAVLVSPATPESEGSHVVWHAEGITTGSAGGSEVSPLWYAAGGLGGVALATSGGGGGSGGSATPAVSTVVASVVGGPAVAGNDLQATLYAADGKTVLGTGSVHADGTVTVSVGGYTGVVIVKVESLGGHADYIDETTGLGKDLGTTVLYSTGVVTASGSTLNLNVNVLTSLAYHEAASAVGASQSLDATTVSNTNAAIAHAFGLTDLTGGAIQTTVDSAGHAQTPNTYGQLLAALSGMDQNNGGNTQTTIESLVAGTSISGTGASLSIAVQQRLIEGANSADPTHSSGLVDAVSNATTQTSASLTIGAVAGDNIITASEQGTTISGTNEAGAAVELSLGGNTRVATVTGTTWSYTLTAADIAAMGQGSEALIVTGALGGTTVQAVRGIYIDTLLPNTPSFSGNNLTTDSTPALSGTADAGTTVTMVIGGATYITTADASGHWAVDTGTAAPVSGIYTPLAEGGNTVTVTSTDTVGNSASATTTLTLDTTAPSAPGLSLTTDTGSSASDHITSNGALTLSGVEAGATVQYSTDGSTWSASFTPVEGSNTVYVRQTDAAGNVSAVSTAYTFTLDTAAPSAPGLSLTTDTGSSASDHITSNGALTLSGVEAGATVQYSTDGSTWSA
ncbi:beta strand repeat-containing protein, partial [Ideonella oryzae]